MDGRGWNTGNQPPVRKNMPPDSPFEEPEQAPELRENRSENLYSRDEPFWNRVIDAPQAGEAIRRDANYWNHPDVMDTDHLLHVDSDTKLQKLQKFLGAGATKRFLAVMAVIVVLAVILYSTLFQVRSIHVVGNESISEQEIIRLSGLSLGQNSMTIDDELVMRKVESNRYLRCTLVDVQWDEITIHVKERTPAVHLNRNGLVVVMDNRGYVLEETLQAGTKYDHLVKVIGMDVRRCSLGQQIVLHSQAQLDAYTQILVELKAMKGLHLLRELDMTSMDSIYLATSEQLFSSLDTEAQIAKRKIIYVRLGSEENIHEKLRAFMITRDKVLEMGYEAGTIDVTDPSRPTFSP